jgi:phage gpG-like protein
VRLDINEIGNNRQKILDFLKKFESDMPDIHRKILGRLAEEVIKVSQMKYLNGAPGNSSVLHSRGGTLSSSIRSWIQGLNAFVGTSLIYAAIHEFGGVITPKNSPYLVFQVNGHWVKTKIVVMPKRAYLDPAIKEVFDQTNKAQQIAELTLQQEIDRRLAA